MEHLIGLGHRRIAHLAGNPDISTTRPRQNAYEHALREAGLGIDRQWVLEGHFNRAVSFRSTHALLRLPKKQRPTAILACNDLSAHGAIDAIQEEGLRVPEDISVVGFDDTWYCSITNPPLTSVNTNVELMGRCAAGTLIAAIEGKPFDARTILPVFLTVRRSSGPP